MAAVFASKWQNKSSKCKDKESKKPIIFNVDLCPFSHTKHIKLLIVRHDLTEWMHTFSNNKRLANKWYLVKLLSLSLCQVRNVQLSASFSREWCEVHANTIYAIMMNESSSMAITLILIWWNTAKPKKVLKHSAKFGAHVFTRLCSYAAVSKCLFLCVN